MSCQIPSAVLCQSHLNRPGVVRAAAMDKQLDRVGGYIAVRIITDDNSIRPRRRIVVLRSCPSEIRARKVVRNLRLEKAKFACA